MTKQYGPYDDIIECDHVSYTNPITGYTKCKKCDMNLPDPYDLDNEEDNSDEEENVNHP